MCPTRTCRTGSVLDEAAEAGFGGLELGPYGYMPLDVARVGAALEARGIRILAGTIFDDLVRPQNRENLLRQVNEICTLITALPRPETHPRQRFAAPYLTVMDWGHDERDYAAGHSGRAPRLGPEAWNGMVANIRGIAEPARDRSASVRLSTLTPAATSSSRTSSIGSYRTSREKSPGSASTPAIWTTPVWTRSRPSGATPLAPNISTSRTSTTRNTPMSWGAISGSSTPALKASSFASRLQGGASTRVSSEAVKSVQWPPHASPRRRSWGPGRASRRHGIAPHG
jgi:hypothetical protein